MAAPFILDQVPKIQQAATQPLGQGLEALERPQDPFSRHQTGQGDIVIDKKRRSETKGTAQNELAACQEPLLPQAVWVSLLEDISFDYIKHGRALLVASVCQT